MNELVSVIIPTYNASGFILETVNSVLKQSYLNFEILIVNDGSTDNTISVVESINDTRVKLFNRTNQGVSAARNFGLENANGDYLIFFDSDDLMPVDFIQERIAFLIKNPFFSFVTGWVQKINERGELIGARMKSACNDLQNEILLYHSDIITCPSGYMFRKQDLITNNLLFDVTLSSAADRYFLLHIDKYIKGHFLRNENSCLYYRIRNESMSNKLNESLIKDNELFYKYVFQEIKPRHRIRKLFLSKSNYILFGAYFKTGHYLLAFKFALISFFIDPLNFIKTIFKKNHDTYYFQ
jgi:glycosyltransferase involved in cell wall biosynthesis